MNKTIKQIFELPFLILAVLIIFYEEYCWEYIGRITNLLKKYQPLDHLGRFIAQSHPSVAILSFFLPMVVLFPIKLAAIWLFASGHYLVGSICYLSIKILGVAAAKWIFIYAETPLRSVYWSNKLIDFAINTSQYIKNITYTHPFFVKIRQYSTHFKIKAKLAISELKDKFKPLIQSKKRKFFHIIKYKKILTKSKKT